MHDEWRWSTMVRCIKTRVISKAVTTTGVSIVEPYYEDLGESGGDESEKRGVRLTKIEFGFMPGRSTHEAIHLIVGGRKI
ncbi:hypothetical protein H5410_000725 [Solanum commersonii]|uniref:Uncharacterized protein n=1 Tax=Solanum commersonii TaxID=4109 RepID=A0A9J6AX11_SOLCO|nr:hypothetical protein H5410_000725 [Solanum commersonii]